MQKQLSSFLRFVIPLSLAVVLLYFAFRNIEFSEFVSKVSEVEYSWVIASILLSLGTYVARAYRWNILLKPLDYHPTVFRTSLSVLVGYLANLAFPRLGEITRCAVLKRTDDVPVPVSIGTVITERIFDAVTLLVLIGVSFLLEYDLIVAFMNDTLSEYNLNFTKILVGLGILGGIAVAVFVIFFVQENKYSARIKEFVRELYGGISSIRRMSNVWGFILSSVVLWVSYYLMSYLIVFSLEETSFLSVSAGFMLLVTGGIALALPVQGGIGTYHTMVTAMLALYGINKSTGLFLATLLHTSQLLAIAVFGGIALLITVAISRKKNESDKAKDRNAEGSRTPGGQVEEG
jgi:uncharacterized protein (TIRG00374 family)